MSQTRIKIKKNQARKRRRRGARYWMAVGTMAAYATFSGDAVFKAPRPAGPVGARGTRIRPDPGFDRPPLRHSARHPGFRPRGLSKEPRSFT